MFLDFLNPKKKRNKDFHEACGDVNIDRVKVLLDKGADINCHDENGNTALFFQVYKGDERIEFVRFLLSLGADANLPSNSGQQEGVTPIHIASAVGANECIKILLEHSASVHWRTPDGSEAIHSAAIGGNANTVKLLIKAGANINCVNDQKRTPLHNTLITKNITVAKTLIKAGAELEVRDGDDSTALFRAVSDSNLPFTKLFLENGANTEATIESDDLVMYPLQSAVMGGNLKLVKMLVEAGCKVEKKYPGTFTLLEAAEHKGYTKIVSYLRENVQLILPNQSNLKPIENADQRPGMVRFRVTTEGKLEKIS